MHVRAAILGWAFFYVDEPLMIYRVHSGQASKAAGRFRDDQVRLWDRFAFDVPEVERLRVGPLAAALVSRSAWRLRTGAGPESAADAMRARSLQPGGWSLREKATLWLAGHPHLASPVVSVINRVRLLVS